MWGGNLLGKSNSSIGGSSEQQTPDAEESASYNRMKNNSDAKGGKNLDELLSKKDDIDDDQDPETASQGSGLMDLVNAVLPKIERLPWTTFMCLSIWCAVPSVIYILLFTQMGYGEMFYYSLSHSQLGEYDYLVKGCLILSGFLFYIFDIDEWNTAFGSLFRFISLSAMFAIFVFIVILVSNDVPFGIITLFALLNPLWLLMVNRLFYRDRDTRTFVSWLSGPLLLIAVLTLVSFIVWVWIDYSNEWNDVTKIEAAERTGCMANFEDYPNCYSQDATGSTCFYVDYSDEHQVLVFPDGCDPSCMNVYDSCSNGFMLWGGPILICLSNLFLSFFGTFLRKEGKTTEADMFNFGKLWIFVLFMLWASASLSGTAAGVTSSLISLTMANVVGSGIFLSAIFKKEEIDQNREAILAKMREKYGDNLDVARGLFVVTCSPIVAAYFLLSAINQLVRRVGINPCSQPTNAREDSTESPGIVTVRAKKQITKMKSWDRVKVFTYAVYWGIAYMILQVLVANLTVVFLSWMIEKTADFGLGAVTAIMCGVGVLMFLLPPVPGVPVYLTLGIVLAAQGNELLGWTGSILYATGVGLVLKLFSSALQQKGIGENLSHYVKVRQFVSINSTLMKSMRLVLGGGGLSVPKVAILVGGPDWPTSVLCGIMRLSLPQILIGTIPVVFLIFPTCLTGALLYMASVKTDEVNPLFPWAATASSLTATATALVQFGSMIVAAYYLEQVSGSRAEEVKQIEDDKEVKEADEKDERLKRAYEVVTKWATLPFFPKTILVLSLVSITASCYLVQFFTAMCFHDHSLTDSIDENLGGNVGNLFLPLGWLSLALFCLSIMLLAVFTSWGELKAKRLISSEKAVPLGNSNDPEVDHQSS